MSGFANSVIGGVSTLIRKAIKSPDYSPGVAGWSINKDGTAEFNDATFRGTVIIDSTTQALLVYNGTPALGNLVAAISPENGLDQFGNSFFAGMSVKPSGTNAVLYGLGDGPDFSIILVTLLLRKGPHFRHAPQTAEALFFDFIAPSEGVAFGSGFIGKYYAAQASFSENIASGGLHLITSLSGLTEQSDYGAQWVGATFTAPVNGIYDAMIYEKSPVAAPMVRPAIAYNGVTVAVGADTSTPTTDSSCSLVSQLMLAGDTLTFECQQNSGAAQTVTGNINVARRL